MKKTVLILILALSLLASSCAGARSDGWESSDATLKETTSADTTVPDTTSHSESSSDTFESTSDTLTSVTSTEPPTTAPPQTNPPTTNPPTTEKTTTDAVTTPPETEKEPPVSDTYKVKNYDNIKAIWLSQFDLTNVYVKNGKQRDETGFRILITAILDNCRASGFNTVFLQIRPNADSFYPSEYYSPSRYAVGSYSGSFSYDSVKIVVELARERGFSVHAWINPMRGMTDSEIKQLPSGYAIKEWYDSSEQNGKYLVKNGNNWYLNPAYGDVRELIVNGAREALALYSFDGLHMDDYFYPTTAPSFDSSAYSDYISNGGSLSLADWRRNNLNKLVKALYDVTKSVNSEALYGISPAGNWNTVYDSQYADYKTWCGETGYIDYICPQVYFGLEHQNYDFVKTSSMWQSFIKTDSIKLIIGMTLGKAVSGVDQWAGTGKNEWSEHKDIIKRCIEESLELEKCTGISIFCYQYLYDPISGKTVSDTLEEKNNFLPVLISADWKK